MKRSVLAGAGAVAAALALAPLSAHALLPGSPYVGAGIGYNDISDWDNATGYQIFGGFALPVGVGPVQVAGELGYTDSGDFSRTGDPDVALDGVWLNAVGSFQVGPQLSLLGRAGWDFGDDDGFMFGAGVGYRVNIAFEVRGEYVVRDEMDSIQANFLVHF